MSLRNAMFRNAIRNNNATVQIFLAKNQLGMSDKLDHSVADDGQLKEFAQILKDMK